jgi:hypothetical protein
VPVPTWISNVICHGLFVWSEFRFDEKFITTAILYSYKVKITSFHYMSIFDIEKNVLVSAITLSIQ